MGATLATEGDGGFEAAREKRRAYNRAYRKAHLAEHAAAELKWRRENPEAARERHQKSRARRGLPQTPGLARHRLTAEEVATYKSDWRKANPDKVREQKARSHERHRAKNIARVARWREDNRDRHRAQGALRNARKRGAAGVNYTTSEMVAARMAFYGNRCVYCGEDANSIDHRIPLSRGGSHWPANLVPACRSCNSKKNAKTQSEYEGVIGRIQDRQRVQTKPRTADRVLSV